MIQRKLTPAEQEWAHGVVERLNAPPSAPGEFWTTLRIATVNENGQRVQGHRAFAVDADGRLVHPVRALGPDRYSIEMGLDTESLARDDGEASMLSEWERRTKTQMSLRTP